MPQHRRSTRQLTFALPPIPALILAHIPISYGNSCFLIRILAPPGASRYPPKCLARRRRVLCLSISHDSMVVVLAPSDHRLRTNRMKIANTAKPLTTKRMNRCIICTMLGPRYCSETSANRIANKFRWTLHSVNLCLPR